MPQLSLMGVPQATVAGAAHSLAFKLPLVQVPAPQALHIAAVQLQDTGAVQEAVLPPVVLAQVHVQFDPD